MARYPLSLPVKLKEEAENLAQQQGVSLNQFILWSLAEKVGALRDSVDDPAFPRIAYRAGAAGQPVPVIRGTGIRVQALVAASQAWEMAPGQIASEYGLSGAQVKEALAFYEVHRAEIDLALAAEQALEAARG